MAKTTRTALIWLQEDQKYFWRDEKHGGGGILREETDTWREWLASHTSFSFRGREGHLTLLKETRARGGDGYWYAYRHLGKRTVKKYVGRQADLTFARLERTAREFLRTPEQTRPVRHDVPAGGASHTCEQGDWQAADQSHQSSQYLSSSLSTPLLIPKFQLPPLHSSLISRERLLALLDQGLAHKLTLVSAPAGFGKTTLVRQWLAERDLPPIAWVSLDAHDNDPVRFWRYLMTACQAFRANLAHEALALLQTIPQPPFESSLTETALAAFLNALAQREEAGLLILDDYHMITSPQIQETMTFFLDHLPVGIHVILLTRSDPPFPLARLRARNELYEVRTSALRFSLEEMAAFLQQTMAVALVPEIIQQLNTHLEGWVAGLRMLLLVLQGRTVSTEIESFLRTFSGNQRALQEYFLAEVLDIQPEPVQRFLLQTSALSHLTGSLCDAVTGEHDSEHVLERLERANLFLEPLDHAGSQALRMEQPWYRYHGLFAEAMRAEARRRLGEDVLRTLSSRASRWYEAQSLHAEAVEFALQAQDYERAATLIEHMLEAPHTSQQASEYHTQYRWLEQIPEHVLQQHPALCLGYATALLFVVVTWQLPQTTLTLLEKFLRMAEDHYRAEHNLPRLGKVFAFRALVFWRQDEAVQAASSARQALLWLSAEQQSWRSLSLSVAGKAELLYYGQVDEARRLLGEAAALSEKIHNDYFKHAITNMLATVFFEQGALYRASEYYQRALDKARERMDRDDMGYALLGLARIAYERNELEMAQQQAEEVLAIGKSLGYELHEIHATLLLAQVQHAQGETVAAIHRLTMSLARMPATMPDHAQPFFRDMLTLRARLALAIGNQALVQRWVTDLDSSSGSRFPYSSEREALMMVRWQLAQGRGEEALQHQQRVKVWAGEAGRQRTSFEAQALLALIYAERTQQAEAQQVLQDLLIQTRTEGYLRLFLDEGETMATLLRSLLPYVHEKPLCTDLQSILRAFPGSPAMPGTSLLEPISQQELRVLRQLVSRRSNAEIAQDLVVSVNTIRTQVQSIYRKLGVHSRAEASEVARQLRLV